MTIKCELSADRERGPGYGLIRVTGLPAAGGGPVDFRLERNQGTTPYLGRGGVWQATEAWHSATGSSRDATGALVIPLGPVVVDAIVAEPPTVAYQLSVAEGTAKATGTLKVHRPLLGSGAAAPEPPPLPPPPPLQQPPPTVEPMAPAVIEAPPPIVEPPIVTPVEPVPRPRWPLIAVLAALAVIGAAGAAWYGCLIEGFGAPRCTAAITAAPAPAETPPTPAPAPEPTLAPGPTPQASPGSANCVGLDAAACLARAQEALARKDLEPARQLFQQAADLGAVEANIALARMYDPARWSRDASPAGEASWETAVYWYEKAARQGNAEAQLEAGNLLCAQALTDFERNQGLAYLRQAVQAGNAAAQPLLNACEAKTK